ncbi:Hemin import ATP-binding protein HmuV [Waddlia chondrophila 2032/99]|uniref:Hemin import ATP-binding protein HmuV n=2 Tax=Waddlia chondrophila TaxID=71667 RepID=F8LB26_9BACT|nr:ABC transporter ATP-binding protein [Waddlia chondrophila]ADI38749.1 putative ABC-type Fe3+-siderophore transporter, ATPase subunit [Waddlia chondrophila WSU 86-1044]CCB90690.1 Hemin import ATP-binding protein HmuV [Waddlia chondrophila 2032/99]
MLEAKNIAYSIDGKMLVENINLSFFPGILYGILGPNGSGKSTLLKTLSGIWNPTKGIVKWKGKPLLARSRKQISSTISLVPQNPQVHFDFTVAEMVRMGRYPYGSKHCDAEIEKALNTVDAWHLRKRSILHLSHGERKRVYIARALVTESPILLLDEPEASLDIKHQLEIWKLLRKLAEQDKTIIVTNHDLAATQRFCDEVAILNQGRCVCHGQFDQVMTPQRLLEVFGVVESANFRPITFETPS